MNGLLRIPLSEIEALCRLKGYGHRKRQEFLHLIERMDVRFMEHVEKTRAEEQVKEQQKQAAQARAPRRR